MKRMLLAFTTFLSIMVCGPSYGTHAPNTTTLYETNSLYQYIMVDQDYLKKERYILVNTRKDRPQGGISVLYPDKLIYGYTRLSFTSLAFLGREPEKVLFVGLGAGVMPRYFNRFYPEAVVDVVEIDPEIFKIAKKYFYFKEESRMNVYIQDGRMFVKRAKGKYDMIFLDAYRGEQIPFHLTTLEFLEELKKKMEPGGIVVSNILSSANNRYFWSMVKTYQKAFGSLTVYRDENMANFIFVARVERTPVDNELILERAEKIQRSRAMDIDLKRVPWDYLAKMPEQKIEILTDDFAPVNLYKNMELKN